MAASYVTAVRTSRMTAVRDAIDAGAGAGKCKFYTGSSPGVNNAVGAQVLLGTLTCSDPCGTVTSGVLNFSAFTADSSADADGTAAWARFTTSADATVADVTVGLTGSGADIILNTVNIVAGGSISVTGTPKLTEGNP
jgi:hypothetical protein